MGLSLFLAKLIGLYFLIVAVIMLFRKDEFYSSARELIASKAYLMLDGAINLLLGLAIAIGHPIWEFGWRGLITFVGYLCIFKGVMRLAFPTRVQAMVKNFMDDGYWIILVIVALLGFYLTYSGFMVHF